MLQNSLPFFSKLCLLSESLDSVLVKWDHQNKKISVVSNIKTERRKLIKKCFIHAILVLVLLQGGYQAFSSSQTQSNWGDFTLFSATAICNSGALLLTLSCQSNASTICMYINGLLEYSSKHGYGNGSTQNLNKRSFMAAGNLLLAHLLYWSIILIPVVLFYGFHLLDPCKPAVTGYWLIPQCNALGSILPGKWWCMLLILKLLVLFGNHLMWSFVVNVGGLISSGLSILCTETLENCIKM